MPGVRFAVLLAAISLLSVRDTVKVVPRFVIGAKHAVEPRHDMAAAESDEQQEVYSYAQEQAAIRAYPADTIPGDATAHAQAVFQSFKASGKTSGQWSPIGPLNQARYPQFLDQFLFDGAEYTAAGRVTAMAIDPNCSGSKCRLYVGAAGGGVWVTDHALNGNPGWTFISGSLPSNAIGALLIDPADASGNTLYVGTGEPNASVDSEAGVGIFKTTDGGATWSQVPGSGIFFQRAVGTLAFDKDHNLLCGAASSVRGVSSDDGGALSGGSTTHPLVTRGVYRQTGSTFTLLRATNIRGTTQVAVDPNDGNVLYQASFAEGVWRSTNNGATWTQIKTALNPAYSNDRAAFALAKLPGGKTRMYVGIGAQGSAAGLPPAIPARFYRTDDAAGVAAFTDMTTAQNNNYCTGQCWYDNYVVSPAGYPDVVYIGGSFDYNNLHGRDNGRAILLSTDGGATFSDLTQDGDPQHAEAIHPDEHALVTVPGSPLQFICGSDGGVVRSDGNYADVSAKCDARGMTNPADVAYCKSLLSRVPNQLTAINSGLPTLQFQSLSVSAQRPQNLLQGGTQDNGTFQYSSAQQWPQIIYGDGGQSGFKVTDDSVRFNTFSGQANDANFHNGDVTRWVIISAPIISSPEGSLFYPPIIADPSPAAAGSIFQGSFSVWRTQDWGGDQATLEANCSEFTTAADQPGCGDFVRIGDGVPSTQLTSTAWGSKAGGAVAWMARAPQNTGTMWAVTTGGRVFVTDNANDAASSVHWTRLDTSAQPARAITTVIVDPANANHAWLSFSGYNVTTPGQPGHVFEVTRSGATATFVDRSGNLDDLPATAVAFDNVTGDLYSSTDFAVFRLANGSTSWVMTGGLPMVEVAGLTIVPSARVLYAATHGLGAWAMDLSKVK